MDEANTSVSISGKDRALARCTAQEGLDGLVLRMARGDESALAEFYDATAGRTYALATRITREPAAGEEVVSDVYLQVWQQAARYDTSRGPVLPWLLTICRSRAIDYIRRRDRATLHPEPATLRPDLYRNDIGPVDLLLAVERDSRVHSMLRTLDEQERKLVSLVLFEDLSHGEIAAYTGLPLGSVKTTLRRAMQLLRGQLLNGKSHPDGPS